MLALGDPNVLSRNETLQLLRLLSRGLATYTLRGIDREADTWGEDGASGRPTPMDFRYINGSFPTLEAIDKHLKGNGLPPLREWESYAKIFGEEEAGRYIVSVVEDEDGLPDEEGGFLVDYLLEIQISFSVPLVPEDIPQPPSN